MRWLMALWLALALPCAARAQEDAGESGGFISDFLENTLSGDNRNVKVTGLEGALSSRSTIERIDVSDDAGVWLSLEDVVLDWNRLALVRGRFSVNELSAQAIHILRPPGVSTPQEGFTAEAAPFALPELPVSVLIDTFEVNTLTVDEALVGLNADLGVNGRLTLADGVLDLGLVAARLDRTSDRFDLGAQFSNETRLLDLNITLHETAGGLISTALNIPDQPDIDLSIAGSGPLSDLTTDILLATNGSPRITGRVDLVAGSGPGAPLGFDAALSGDLRPLMAPQFHGFFGPEARFDLIGNSYGDGRLDIGTLNLQAQALSLRGALALDAQKRPTQVHLTGHISDADQPVTLPGGATQLTKATLSATLDRSQSDRWRTHVTLNALDHPALTLADGDIRIDGIYTPEGQITGDVVGDFSGLALSDPALAQAAGTILSLDGQFDKAPDGALTLHDMALRGADYRATLDGRMNGLASGFALAGRADLDLRDLSRFSALAQRPLSGALNATLSGTGAPLGGMFDVVLNGFGTNLAVGIAQIDTVMTGQSDLIIAARRDTAGMLLQRLELNGRHLNATARGRARQGGSTMQLSAKLADVGLLLKQFIPQITGALTTSGTATRKGNLWTLAAQAQGPAKTNSQYSGTYNEATGHADMTTQGNGHLGIANLFIAPAATINGTFAYNLALRGVPALSALSGQITTSGATLSVPKLRNSLTDIAAQISVQNGTATVSATGAVKSGGRVQISGPIALTAPFDGTLDIALQQIGITDNISYDSSANGQLRLAGPLVSAPKLSGQIDIGETEVNIATASGAPGVAPIPDITHVGEPAAVNSTRQAAGLVQADGADQAGAGMIMGFDVRISAPSRIFVRGRGLDAELGGLLFIRGTSQHPEPAGQIELIRGRLDLFGRRLTLSKGLITLQGNLQPYIEFVATTTPDDGEASLEVSGTLDRPEINVYSSPERPTEEALALLVFGNEFTQLSPLKIAQLAASLARMAGHGSGAETSLRETLGVDSVGVSTDSDGTGQVGAGAYLSEEIYSDITVNTEGETEINLNLDVTEHLRLRGSVDSNSDSSVGLFFEKDY